MPLSLTSTISFRNGDTMPRLGFGVYQSQSPSESTLTALKTGYRHVDSARVYRNEAEVSAAVVAWQALHKGEGPVFLTSKVASREQGSKAVKAVDSSNERVGSLNWDLFLLHDACAGPAARLEAWRVLERKRDEGKLRHIGVSNFSEKHLEELKLAGCSTPEVNQVELHPFCQQKPIVEYCRREGIIVEAYCPIVRGGRLDDEVVVAIASETPKTPAQVLIRWSLQKGYVPLVKSDTPSRIQENANVFDFELSEEQMSRLDALDEGAKGACSWNPVGVL